MNEAYKLNPIYGSRVFLRPIQMDDTPLILKWRNNPEVRKNFIFQEALTKEIHTNWMLTKVASGEVVQYIIILQDTHTPVGSVYLRDIDQMNLSAEFGIFIGEDSARGKGIGSVATRLFIQSMFSSLHLHKIFLRVLADNSQAYNSYLNAGFKLEGISRDMVYLNNAYKNIIFMSILEKEVTELK